MAKAENPDREKLIADAWKRWRKADYTWDGLTSKLWTGWSIVREGESEYAIENKTGRRYGEPKLKSQKALPLQTVRDATIQDYWRADPSTAAILDDSLIEAQLIRHLGQPTYHSAHLPVEYEDKTPSAKAEWPDDAMDGLVAQRLALRDETAQFEGGVWLRAPNLDEAEREIGQISYLGAIFAGVADFEGTTFAGDTNFREVTFTEAAMFDRARFEKNPLFFRANFMEEASFDDVKFTDHATFSRSNFASTCNFCRVTFARQAIFFRVNFVGDLNFYGSTISGDAMFVGASFNSDAIFTFVTFSENTKFYRAAFTGEASFIQAKFDGNTSFGLAHFSSKAYFMKIRRPPPEQSLKWHAAFHKTTFRDILDLTNSGFSHFATFDGAVIKGGVLLDFAPENRATEMFIKERNAARRSSKTTGQNKSANKLGRDGQLAQLERGCRVLKQQMDKQSDKQREQLLYKFELLARRAQSSLRLGEKTFSYLYDWAADYGASIIRPFIALAMVILAFAAIYTGWAFLIGGVGQGPRQVDLEHAAAQALNFALANSFKPLSALSADAGTAGTIIDGLLNQNVWVGIGVRLVSILQSLLSVTLAFLFGLSVRRRFQIN